MAELLVKDPFRNSRFRLNLAGKAVAGFSELTITDSNGQTIDSSAGNEPPYMRKLSGLTTFGNLTLKRGITDSPDLFNWAQSSEQMGAQREEVTLIVSNVDGVIQATLRLFGAWPSSFEAVDALSTDNEQLIEKLVLQVEKIERVT